jgi:chloramphenicol 3-O phosphotransferase
MMAGFHRGVMEIVRAGNSVIIDEMLLDERLRDDWLELLTPWQPLLVGVFCADEELARREKARRGRPGLARWSARHAHRGMTYDLVLDTTADGPLSAAVEIAKILEHGKKPEVPWAEGSRALCTRAADRFCRWLRA